MRVEQAKYADSETREIVKWANQENYGDVYLNGFKLRNDRLSVCASKFIMSVLKIFPGANWKKYSGAINVNAALFIRKCSH